MKRFDYGDGGMTEDPEGDFVEYEVASRLIECLRTIADCTTADWIRKHATAALRDVEAE